MAEEGSVLQQTQSIKPVIFGGSTVHTAIRNIIDLQSVVPITSKSHASYNIDA